MSLFDSLLPNTTLESVRATIIGYVQSAGLRVTNWATGSTAQQMLEVVTSVGHLLSSVIPVYIRGFASLDTATDPGDVDPYDASNAGLPQTSGFLSNLGANVYSTPRLGATAAVGTVRFHNNGAGARSIKPGALIFTWTLHSPPSPAPTYVNSSDPAIYTNPDGSVTVAPGTYVDIPVVAQEVGPRASCPAGSLSLTTTLLGCSGTNLAAMVGSERESATAYRTRCRQAAARLSLVGSSDSVAYLARANLDGSALINYDGQQVAINRVQVVGSSSTGEVTVYYASPTGATSSADKAAADLNLQKHAYAIGDCITFSSASATIDTVTVGGYAKIRAASGVTATAVAQGLISALQAYAAQAPIGGLDQVNGAGTIYVRDLERAAAAGYAGVYDVAITSPGTDIALARGHALSIASSPTINWTITIVP